ncbi:MAG: polysaccharide pyruvyl transferase family protein [Okeania sp. SIO3B5]|uniref:polysaccharide pyruvyl transferase family protein n=1 Tax=Okeania sp. SIO3B5 TaxID=2607811 RepID=UPI0014011763|nr:polysaccharide pyruvyl transferase family protein [Okeania sp. SIO3B5]NEO57005.1 polysaccharide pyruvyl transferase family protein [Okeania sp. SIO3B5]
MVNKNYEDSKVSEKKVGIITFHHTSNYGATLQAYALWKYIDSLGYNVEIIDYRPLKAVWHYLKDIFPIRRLSASEKKFKINSFFIGQIIKSIKMRLFLKSKMKLSQKTFYQRSQLLSYDHQYNVAITGSDQTWCINSIRDFDTSFFLDFINGENTCKISYAPSFGTTKNLGDNHTKIVSLLQDYKMISVRDSNGIKILNSLGVDHVKKVLDPTFLIDYIDYTDLLEQPKYKNKYILMYNHHGIVNTNGKKLVKKLVEKQDLEIISLGNPTASMTDKNFVGISVPEWLGYFYNASYIITNSFHGVVFSIIFQKNFSFIPYGNTNQKVMDLLETFDLKERLLDNQPDALDNQQKSINYATVNNRREDLVKYSQQYLQTALNV